MNKRPRAVCIEDRHGFAEELIKLGFDVERHNHLAVPSGLMEHITRELLNRHIHFMYIDFPTSVKLGNREAGYWQRVAAWAKFSTQSGILFATLAITPKTYCSRWHQLAYYFDWCFFIADTGLLSGPY